MNQNAFGTPFDALKGLLDNVTIHNVRLVDVQPGDDGFERLTVELDGITDVVIGAGRWDAQRSRRDVGSYGQVVTAKVVSIEQLPGACFFYPYADQTLRRAPELDGPDRLAHVAGRNPEVIGWRSAACPEGFRAPVGLVPGEGRGFESDRTEALTLRVPPEFAQACRQVQRTSEEVLRGFIADLAGIDNYVSYPRADGYSSNGSDERDYAQAWLDRAYGMWRVDESELVVQDEESEQRSEDRNDIADLLDDYVDKGGDAADLLKIVKDIVYPRNQVS